MEIFRSKKTYKNRFCFYIRPFRSFTPAFTLVELIVVISILAILGTIAFLSIQNYSGSARDGERIADINGVIKTLEISQVQSNSYPLPDNSFTVTYSWGTVWTQGTIGSGVVTRISAGISGGGINKRPPLDPLQSAEYVYSTLAYGKPAYQIKANYEWDSLSYNSPWFVEDAYAATGNPSIAYIRGNYNGVTARTQTGGITYVLAVPSIVTGTGGIGSVLKIENNDINNTLLVNGGSNTTGVTFNANVSANVYGSGALPSTDAERLALATKIATAYSGTTLATNSNIAPFVNALGASNSGTLLTALGDGMVSTSLWGSSSTASTTTPTVPGASTALTGTGGNAQVALTWTAPASNGGASISNYRVYWGTVSGTYTGSGLVGSATTSYTVSSLTNGTTYYFAVATINSVGEGTKSGEISKVPAAVCTHGSTVFNYTGGNQNFVVPAGCVTINVKAWGAGGGNQSAGAYGAWAGFASGALTVTSGETLVVVVGQGWTLTNNISYGGGGAGSWLNHPAAGGGWRSAIMRSGNDIITAWGWGGSNAPASNDCGGAHGGLGWGATGGSGNNSGESSGGGGGSQAAWGTGGPGGGVGGNGSLKTWWNGGGCTEYGGGGGGGGYYGGGGGGWESIASCGAAGGGGSSYIPAGGTTISGSTPNAANSADTDYVVGIGKGWLSSVGGNGLVKIYY